MASQRSLYFSNSFVISCGTVTLDVNYSKILIIYWRRTGEYLLPKGRKDIAETLEQTALRETFEETGHRVQLLPLSIETLHTSPNPDPVGNEGRILQNNELTTESLAVTQRVTLEGVLKIIFWFVAKGNSGEASQTGTKKEGEEEFETLWVPVEDAVKTLSFDDDKQVAGKALKYASSLLDQKGIS